MADTADRRSEGRVYSTKPAAVAARRRYHERKAQGLCPRTGKRVANRVGSYEAVDKQALYNQRSNTITFCLSHGINTEVLESIPGYQKILKPLIKLVKRGEKRRKKRAKTVFQDVSGGLYPVRVAA